MRLAIALCALLCCGHAHAYGTARQLVADCTMVPTQPEEAFQKTKCLGYVGGVLDSYGVVSGLYPNVRIFCGPSNGLSVDQTVAVLVQGLRADPARATTPARSAILLALRDRYTCK